MSVPSGLTDVAVFGTSPRHSGCGHLRYYGPKGPYMAVLSPSSEREARL